MKKINLKNIFKNKPEQSFLDKTFIWPGNAERDWRVMVYVFAVGLISLSVFAWKIYLSDQIAGGYFTPETTQSDISVKTLSIKKLQADLLLMQNKQAEYLKLKTTSPKIVDPAI